ncbi:hypothetical protein PFISCL1PPCAC_18781, partial [Pristionchus fissidentatus]
DKYVFRSVTPADKDLILKMVNEGFLKSCPHSRTFNMTPDTFRVTIYPDALKNQYSRIVIEKESGKVIGFRLYSISHRDQTKDIPTYDVDPEAMTEDVIHYLTRILAVQKQMIWELKPSVNKLLRQELTFIEPEHQRNGIGSKFISLLNLDELKKEQVDGIQSEATSHSNQQMLTKLGYVKLSEAQPEDYVRADGTTVKLPDETTSLKLFYKAL